MLLDFPVSYFSLDHGYICRKSDLGEDNFPTFHSGVKRGDIVGIVGFPGSRQSPLLVVTLS